MENIVKTVEEAVKRTHKNYDFVWLLSRTPDTAIEYKMLTKKHLSSLDKIIRDMISRADITAKNNNTSAEIVIVKKPIPFKKLAKEVKWIVIRNMYAVKSAVTTAVMLNLQGNKYAEPIWTVDYTVKQEKSYEQINEELDKLINNESQG